MSVLDVSERAATETRFLRFIEVVHDAGHQAKKGRQVYFISWMARRFTDFLFTVAVLSHKLSTKSVKDLKDDRVARSDAVKVLHADKDSLITKGASCGSCGLRRVSAREMMNDEDKKTKFRK